MTVLRDDRPRARKRHRCYACHTTIEPGEVYRQEVGIWDQVFYRAVSCLDCEAIEARVWKWTACTFDEGIDAGTFEEWSADTVATNPDDEEARSYLARRFPDRFAGAQP